MRLALSAFFLVSASAFASLEVDPAEEWLRDDAPHVYLVRQGETEADAALRFVKEIRHWPEVWCPWPGYDPAVPVGPGDLLVRVQVNGRSWIQRAKLGNGDQPHARALATFDVSGIEPSTWIPDAQLHPPQHITFDLTEVDLHEPARAVHQKVSEFWPSSEALPWPVARVDAGRLEFLSIGTALMVIPAGKETEPAAWLHAVVVAVFPSYSYVLLLEPEAVATPGDSVRSPTAWCFRHDPAPVSE